LFPAAIIGPGAPASIAQHYCTLYYYLSPKTIS
jgi:hypothetical protein